MKQFSRGNRFLTGEALIYGLSMIFHLNGISRWERVVGDLSFEIGIAFAVNAENRFFRSGRFSRFSGQQLATGEHYAYDKHHGKYESFHFSSILVLIYP